MKNLTTTLLLFLAINAIFAQRTDFIQQNYVKKEVYIPMRDGTRLYTAIYSPRDSLVKYPILMVKTPYGIRPYGEENFPEAIGPSPYLEREKYIFVHQDARGMFMSEGRMVEMTPHLTLKPDSTYVDNSTDTYDAVEWLLHHTNNNGKVCLWGISYRGFYASSGIIDAHPALACSSPQACIADWFVGDDVHHNGAFALLPNYLFYEAVCQIQKPYAQQWPEVFDYPVKDAYNFFLNLGPLDQVNHTWFENKVPAWDTLVAHPNYDSFWQERNILPHLKNIKPAVLVTAGLFDHENLYGSLQTYQAIKYNSNNDTRLVLGPWIHGGWARTKGESFGILQFGESTSDYYQREIEMPFFNFYLKQKGTIENLPKVMVFITGSNKWHRFDTWPPAGLDEELLFLNAENALSESLPDDAGFTFDVYISDPEHPVPYTSIFHPLRLFYNKEYMAEDQRFAGSRPDVLTYQTDILTDTLTLLGPVKADLYIASTTTDYDIVVKVIDVYPNTIKKDYYETPVVETAGYQQLVRTEIFRAKYRNSYEFPEAIIPKEINHIRINLNDISHSFLPGHRIMVQIQSSMFPLYDRNPQTFMNIYEAGKEDFQSAGIMIYRSKEYPSSITFGVLKD
jgi:putative CocE/NonD family hydrolase